MKCPICDRETPKEFIEKHHLIPKVKKGTDTILVCSDCGDMIHQIFNNNELKNHFNTIEKLKSSEKIKKWIKWVSKKKNSFGFCMSRKKKV